MNAPSLPKQYSIAIAAGLFFAVAWGTVDIAYKIINLNFSWISVYLAIFTPALYLVPGAIFLQSALNISSAFLKTQRDLSKLFSFYRLVLLILLSFHLAYVSFIFVAPSLMIGATMTWQAVGTAALLMLLSLSFLLFSQILFRPEEERGWSWLRAIGENYAFLSVVFMSICFVADLILLKFEHKLRAFTAAEPAQQIQKPNVILVTLDTLRADHVSSYGYKRLTTPFLDSIAARSSVFLDVSSTTSWTLPSHASLFTGKFTANHGAHHLHEFLTSENLTLAEILRGEGYRTAGFAAGPYCKAKFGIAQGFETYRDRMDFFEYRAEEYLLSWGEFVERFVGIPHRSLTGTDGEVDAHEINADALQWLSENGKSPFFLFLNYFDVHLPYDSGVEYRARFETPSVPDEWKLIREASSYLKTLRAEKRYEPTRLSEKEIDFLRGAYDAELYLLDRRLEAFFEKLEQGGYLENTIVIFTGDHGEEFGEHQGLNHGITLFEEMIQIPLFFFYKGQITPQRIDTPVSIVDIMPTLLELLGLPVPKKIDGQTLLPFLRGEKFASHRNYSLMEFYGKSGFSSAFALREGYDKFISVDPERGRMETSLFDLRSDPGEQENLLRSSPNLAAPMKQRLDKFVGPRNR